jgi:nicotinic acid mononucleotide adenylyltransferase
MTTVVATSPQEVGMLIKQRLEEEIECIRSQPLTEAERLILDAVRARFSNWIDIISNMPTEQFEFLRTYNLATLLTARSPPLDCLALFVLVGTFDPPHWGHLDCLLVPLADAIERRRGKDLALAVVVPNGQYPPSLPGSDPGRAWKPGKACEEARFAMVEYMTAIVDPLIGVSDFGRRFPRRGAENAFALASELANTAARKIVFNLVVGRDGFEDWVATYVEYRQRHEHRRVRTIIQVMLDGASRLNPDKVEFAERAGIRVVVRTQPNLGLSSTTIRTSGLSLLSPEMKRIRERYLPQENLRKEFVIGLCALLARLPPRVSIEEMLAAHLYLLEPAVIEFVACPSAHDRLCAVSTEVFRRSGSPTRVSRIGWDASVPDEVRLTVTAEKGGGPGAARVVAVAMVKKAESDVPVRLQEQWFFVSVQESLP